MAPINAGQGVASITTVMTAAELIEQFPQTAPIPACTAAGSAWVGHDFHALYADEQRDI